MGCVKGITRFVDRCDEAAIDIGGDYASIEEAVDEACQDWRAEGWIGLSCWVAWYSVEALTGCPVGFWLAHCEACKALSQLHLV